MNIVFMGTPEFAASHLKTLVESGIRVTGVFSQPDRPKGRGRKVYPTPVKSVAEVYGLPVFQPEKISSGEGLERLKELSPDLVVVVAYGKLLKSSVIDLPPLGCFNVHASLLPKYRGAAPIQRAIESGETRTGITIFKIDEGMDTGEIALMREIEIENSDNFGSLYEKLERLGREALIDFLKIVETGRIELYGQAGEPSYAPKVQSSDLVISDFSDAVCVLNKVRAFDPEPGARASLDGKMVKLFGAVLSDRSYGKCRNGEIVKVEDRGMVLSCGTGNVIISLVQLPGKKPMSPKDAVSGRLIREGMILGG
ncbi:MAG: methionyl-tRNA formyltransferase [Kosmotogaceae bacterium]|nr:methionyl-tRNA formyltransferase [Kosmotogaceae bacterium]